MPEGTSQADEAARVSNQVRTLYEDVGWKEVAADVSFDAQTGEDLRPVARAYLSATRRRVLRHLPASGDRLLDMASGPIQYPEYLEYSSNFNTRVCVDLSQRALDMARSKIGSHGEYLCGDFFELQIPANSMDAVVSLHTIYHIHATRQGEVVRKLIDVARPGASVVVVYSNPDNLVSTVLRLARRLLGRHESAPLDTPEGIYFQPQPLSWWWQFSGIAEIQIFPWRSLSTPVQMAIIPKGWLGRKLLAVLFRMEDWFPRLFVRFGCYPMIVLRKRSD